MAAATAAAETAAATAAAAAATLPTTATKMAATTGHKSTATGTGATLFVYENAAGQPPQILAGFNGVNVQPEQPGQQLRLQPKPIQTAQQYGGVGPKVVKAPPAAAAAVWAPRVESHPP